MRCYLNVSTIFDDETADTFPSRGAGETDHISDDMDSFGAFMLHFQQDWFNDGNRF